MDITHIHNNKRVVAKFKKAIITCFLIILPAFVMAGSADISWIAPNQREDMSALLESDIAGFKIYYGLSSGNYTNSVTINDGSTVSHQINGLNENEMYFFVVTTIDTDGRESIFSSEVQKESVDNTDIVLLPMANPRYTAE